MDSLASSGIRGTNNFLSALGQIASLLNEGNQLTVVHTEYSLQNNGVHYCTLSDNKTIVAVAGIIKAEEIASKIKHVVVHPNYRRNGYGAMVVQKAMALCTTPYVYSYVRRDNNRSLILFLKLGFEIIRMETGQIKPIILLGRKTPCQ